MQPDYYGEEPARGATPDPYGGYGAKPIQESRLPLYLTFILLGVVCFFAFRYIVTNKSAGTTRAAQAPVEAPLPSEPVAPVAAGAPAVAAEQPQSPVYRPPQVETTVQQAALRQRQSDQTHREGDKSPGWKARALLETSQSDD